MISVSPLIIEGKGKSIIFLFENSFKILTFEKMLKIIYMNEIAQNKWKISKVTDWFTRMRWLIWKNFLNNFASIVLMKILLKVPSSLPLSWFPLNKDFNRERSSVWLVSPTSSNVVSNLTAAYTFASSW